PILGWTSLGGLLGPAAYPLISPVRAEPSCVHWKPMRRGHWAAIATAAVVAAAAAVTAGWGGGAGNALAIDPVAAAATKTQSGAAHVRFTLAFSTPQLQGGKTV